MRPGLPKDAPSLARQWQALLGMALTLARQVLHLSPKRPRNALRKAEMLEAWILCALTEVTQQIETQGADAIRRQKFSEQLPPVACILLCLLRFLQRLIVKLKAALSSLSCWSEYPAAPEIYAGTESKRACPARPP